ncbi:MAG: DUF4199 domain-containing protein [Bacteroidota bacterium]
MAEYKTPVTGHAFRYAGILSAAAIFLLIITYVFDATNSMVIGILNWIIMLAGFSYSGYKFRQEKLDGYISYGKSFAVIFQTGLLFGLITMVYVFIHYSMIDPGALNEMLHYQLEKTIEARPSLTQEELDAIKNWQKEFILTWWGLGISQFISGVFWGLIVGLIASLVLKKEHPNASPFK